MKLPPYISRDLVRERLTLIFPEGTANRTYLIREITASTVFTMLYIGAVEGNDFYTAPSHIYRMTGEQASIIDDDERIAYGVNALKKNFTTGGNRWYADNTRESIRDETLREGLIQVGAVLFLTNLATTSSKPRYFLQQDFSNLFDPELVDEELSKKIEVWQTNNLSAGARARISLAGRTAKSDDDRVLVKFPNGEARNLSAGISSDISKAVIEVFSQTFLDDPAVLWLSTSDAKVTFVDDVIAAGIGLKIQADKNLPDIILVDLGRKETLLVFIEVVATDGAITDRRKNAIYELTDTAGFKREQIAFLTAYKDRLSPGFKKTIPELAWNSFAWFVTEPDNLIYFKNEDLKLGDILKM